MASLAENIGCKLVSMIVSHVSQFVCAYGLLSFRGQQLLCLPLVSSTRVISTIGFCRFVEIIQFNSQCYH